MACNKCGKSKDKETGFFPVEEDQTKHENNNFAVLTEEDVITPCECSGGKTTLFCDRHKCIKSPHLRNLCKYSQHHFDAWEKGEGPMQRVREPEPLPQQDNSAGTGFFISEDPTPEEEFFMGDKEIPVESRGFGDTFAKFTKATGIKKIVKKVVGEDCGCSERQDKLNKIFPYKKKKKTKGFFE